MLAVAIVVVAGSSLPELTLKNGRGNPCCVLEHQPSSVQTGGEQDTSPGQCENGAGGALARSHPAFAGDPPHCQQAEYPQRYEPQGFVSLHHPVDCVTV